MNIQSRTRHHCNESSNGLANLTASKNILLHQNRNVQTLKTRLNQWEDAQIEKLLVEGKTIQERLFKDSTKNQSSEFAQFMEVGKVNKALKLLESSNKGGPLPLTEETFEMLLEKQPKESEESSDILIEEESQNVHPVI